MIKKNKLLWEADKNSSKRTKKKEKRKKKKKFKKIFFEKDSKNSNLDFTRNVVKRQRRNEKPLVTQTMTIVRRKR